MPRDPKGRSSIGFERHVFVCQNERDEGHPRGCCKQKGSPSIHARMKTELKNEEGGSRVRVNKSGCLDFCEQGPTVVVYPEGVWYSIQDPNQDIPEIVVEHLLGGKPVERCRIHLE